LYNDKPDRIPLRLFAEEIAAKYAGYTNFEAACDHDLQFEVNRKFAVELGCDAIQTNSIVNWMGMIKALGWEGIKFPGLELPVHACNQWTEPADEESAFLKADEYDHLIEDPTGFILNVWMPRFTRHIRSPGKPVTFEHNMSLINGTLAYDLFFNTWAASHAKLIEAGVVPAVSSVLKAPLDILGDKLRGYVNLATDLFERREKVIAACEALMPHLFYIVNAHADPERNIPSIIWMHRGCTPFISHKDFEEIYWATLKPIIEELWANGQQTVLYAEGNWDAHLESFAELPEKSVIFHADRTDIFKAHEILGRKFCISGGIPNELLSLGTCEEVRSHCTKIIDSVAQDGGYIMEANALIMDDARIENIKELINVTRDYGMYDGETSMDRTLDEIKKCDRPQTRESVLPVSGKMPGVCYSWEEKKKDLPEIRGDEERVRQMWEKIDNSGYLFCWTNLIW
jgi:hypothetical protein